MTEYKHLMVDIETMGNKSYSSIISIGAVEFNIEDASTGKEFYKRISLESCEQIGLKTDVSTILWWMQQNEQARAEFVDTTNQENIGLVLLEFDKFCNMDYQIWGNSARFDLGLLQNAYNIHGVEIPWNFRNERCVRTLVSFKPEIKDNFVYNGVEHNALADCYKQIGYCSEIWNNLHGKG